MNVLIISEISIIDKLTERIKSSSGRIVYFPLIKIVRLAIADKNIAKHIQLADKIIFQSKNSVRCANKIWGYIFNNKKLECFAVGKFTAYEVLQKIGIKCSYPSDNYSSENLLAMPEMKSVSGKKVIVFKGKGGRNLIGDKLNERGANVESVDVYERRKKNFPLNQIFLDKALPNYVIVLSETSLKIFLGALGNKRDSYNLVFVVPDKRVAKSVFSEKLTQVIVVDNIEDEMSYLNAMKEFQKNYHLK